MTSRVTIKGLPELEADLSELSDDIIEGVRKAREAIAEELASDIDVDTPIDTGTLRRSVGAEGTTVVIGGSTAPYAEDVEEAEPFIRPNIEAMEVRGVDIAAKIIDKEIG